MHSTDAIYSGTNEIFHSVETHYEYSRFIIDSIQRAFYVPFEFLTYFQN